MEWLRQISFTDLESFIDEIGHEAEHIDDAVVRCEISKEPVSNGCDRISLLAGFTVGVALREMTLDCGTSPPDRGDMDGAELAIERAAKIQAACEAGGLTMRRGILR